MTTEKENRWFEPFSELAATAVNQFFGIDQKGVLDINDLPKTIDLSNFWKQAFPILQAHPQDRELGIGWDLVADQLQIVEVVEGLTEKETPQNSPDVLDSDIHTYFGSVTIDNHLIIFHSHVLDPDMTLDKNRQQRVSEATPMSMYEDFDNYALCPTTYAAIIVDTKPLNNIIVGRILVALKTTASLQVNRKNVQDKLKWLDKQMFPHRRVQVYDYDQAKIPFLTSKGPKEMIKKLQSDENWKKTAGLVMYRGSLTTEINTNAKARRSDVLYQKLMGLRKK